MGERLPKDMRGRRDLGWLIEFTAGGRVAASINYAEARVDAFWSDLAKKVREFFDRWKSARRMEGPAKEEWYRLRRIYEDVAFLGLMDD